MPERKNAPRIALVTGGNRGLGFETARALAKRGHLVIVAARSIGKALAAVEALRRESLEVSNVTLDVSSDASVDALVARIEREFGRLDVLVNNAGAIFESKGATGTTQVGTEVMAQAFETNTLGAYRLTRRFLPWMNANGYGRVVNVSSGMGALSDMGGGYPAYRISKAALNALTRVFHAEARGNVKVNSVCPGWVRTDMGGGGAERSVEEGSAGIVWAATLPDDGPSGGFFRDGKPIDF
jgi:NAD(P)-dependent dehydrogenase (short-subunit alcohol dehydrogenase family)